jgi:hypothetical protein
MIRTHASPVSCSLVHISTRSAFQSSVVIRKRSAQSFRFLNESKNEPSKRLRRNTSYSSFVRSWQRNPTYTDLMLHPFSYIIVQIGCLAIGLFLSHPGTLILSSWPVIRNDGIQPRCAENGRLLRHVTRPAAALSRFSTHFSMVRGPNRVLTPLKSASKLLISSFVHSSKIVVWDG